jgi:hypothetical protein
MNKIVLFLSILFISYFCFAEVDFDGSDDSAGNDNLTCYGESYLSYTD